MKSFLLFAQITPEKVAFLIGAFIGECLVGSLLLAVIVAGVCHLFSRSKPHLSFGKVFFKAFIAILVISTIGKILPLLGGA